MKLYRGIKSKKFTLRTQDEEQDYLRKWEQILLLRQKGGYSYPKDLNNEIVDLHKENKLSYQHFTDHKEIAERYAKEQKGSLIEIDLPLKDILRYFTLEFQNYSERKDQFEIVYLVSSRVLANKQREWKLKIIS